MAVSFAANSTAIQDMFRRERNTSLACSAARPLSGLKCRPRLRQPRRTEAAIVQHFRRGIQAVHFPVHVFLGDALPDLAAAFADAGLQHAEQVPARPPRRRPLVEPLGEDDVHVVVPGTPGRVQCVHCGRSTIRSNKSRFLKERCYGSLASSGAAATRLALTAAVKETEAAQKQQALRDGTHCPELFGDGMVRCCFCHKVTVKSHKARLAKQPCNESARLRPSSEGASSSLFQPGFA